MPTNVWEEMPRFPTNSPGSGGARMFSRPGLPDLYVYFGASGWLYRFDTVALTWHLVATDPNPITPITFGDPSMYGNILGIPGHRGTASTIPLVRKYDFTTGVWSDSPNGPTVDSVPFRYSAGVFGNKMCFVGSWTGPKFLYYNFDTNSWTNLGNAGNGTWNQGVACLTDGAHRIGGEDSGSYASTASHTVWNPDTGVTGDPRAVYPGTISQLGVAVAKDRYIFGIGGQIQGGDGTPNCKYYDRQSDAWAAITTMPVERKKCPAACANGYLFVNMYGQDSTQPGWLWRLTPTFDIGDFVAREGWGLLVQD